MPICIECCYPVPQLYHVLHSSNKPNNHSAATKPASGQTHTSPSEPAVLNGGARGTGESKRVVGGGDVRLMQCPRCKRFADKYVEHDFVVLFIDLVLVKPQVYRHLLFNRLGRDDDAFDSSMKRLGILLLLFDVYLTWSSIEGLPAALVEASSITTLPILAQYTFFLLLCTLATLAQHLTIRNIAGLPIFRDMSAASNSPFIPATAQSGSALGPDEPGENTRPANGTTANGAAGAPLAPWPGSKPNAVSTALFVSSCMKLFPILMVVWRYDDVGGQVGRGVAWAVAAQNLEALRILLGCGYLGAAVLVGAGGMAKAVVQRAVLGLVGLQGIAHLI